MHISVVIPTYNNSFILSKTLEYFCNLQTEGNIEWEIIIVGNNCNDNTEEIVSSYKEKLPVKFVTEKRQGTSIAKNTGITNSSGTLIIFTDDDCHPSLNWLKIYWDVFCANSGNLFLGGPVISVFELSPPIDELLPYAPPSVVGLHYGNNQKIISNAQYFIGANWACPRQALDEVGCFDVDMGLVATEKTIKTGEETDLMDRLKANGYNGLYIPEAIVHHFVPTNKTTLKHIASRREAYIYFISLKEFREEKIRRIPKWLWKQLVNSWILWSLSKFTRENFAEKCIQYRCAVGRIRAASDTIKYFREQK